MTINYLLCIIALSCFFFWHKCSTVVAVGVQTAFLPVGGLAYWFFWGTRKSNVPNCAWIAKSVTEKNNSRVDCAEVGKKTVQALHFDRLSGRQAEWAGEKGWGFLPAGDCPGGAARNYHSGETWPLSSELYLLQLSNIIMSIIIWFLVRIVELKIKCWVVFFLSTPSKRSATGGYSYLATLWQRPYLFIFTFRFQKTLLGCGVAVAEGIKAFAEKDCRDFAPQLNLFLKIDFSYFSCGVFLLKCF